MDKRTETISIEGMSCGHCVSSVRRALDKLEGLDVRDVRIGAADIAYDPERVERAAIERAIDDAGFTIPANAAG